MTALNPVNKPVKTITTARMAEYILFVMFIIILLVWQSLLQFNICDRLLYGHSVGKSALKRILDY